METPTREKFSTYASVGPNPRNHGKLWSNSEEVGLFNLYLKGYTLSQMCNCLERSPTGVLPRLQRMGCIEYSSGDGCYYRCNPTQYPRKETAPTIESKPINPETTKETIMPVIRKETRVYIGDTDGADMTDEQLFKYIAKLEAQLRDYEAINHKPEKLMQRLAELRADISAVVHYVDNR